MEELNEICEKIRLRLLEETDYSREYSDDEIGVLLDGICQESFRNSAYSLAERCKIRKHVFNAVREMDVLQEILEDENITEIMINGTDPIFVEEKGKIVQREERLEKEKIHDIVQKIVASCNRTVNEAMPIVDARLPDGSRVNAVLPPIALNGPIVTIRRFPKEAYRMKDLIRMGSLDEPLAEFLKKLVRAKYNLFISGGTGSGKTTFLNALSDYIPKDERIITIEDSAELQIEGVANLVRLETRNSNVDGCVPISMKDLIKTSLRMRPDRIVVGEVRGAEALDMLQAMNTGHDGSLSTGHANSAKDSLSRLETMVVSGTDLPLAAVKKQISSGIDIIIHLGRLRDRTRKVLQIVEVIGFRDGEIQTSVLYEFMEEGEDENGKIIGCIQKKNEMRFKEKAIAAGISI